MSIIY